MKVGLSAATAERCAADENPLALLVASYNAVLRAASPRRREPRGIPLSRGSFALCRRSDQAAIHSRLPALSPRSHIRLSTGLQMQTRSLEIATQVQMTYGATARAARPEGGVCGACVARTTGRGGPALDSP